MKTDFYFQHQNQTWHSPCSAHTSCIKPAFHQEFYIYTPLYCIHRTWTADWEETLHSSWDISTSFSVQIRLKIELCTSTALQSAPAFWAVSLLVFLLWFNAFGCFPASIQSPHLSHEGTKASGFEWRCWSCYKHCKRDRYLPLTSINALISAGMHFWLPVLKGNMACLYQEWSNGQLPLKGSQSQRNSSGNN